jgi:hypothetical protein
MMAAVFIGYFTRALRKDRYNALDDMILDTFKPGKRNDHEHAPSRIVALENFVLTMSDQQFVIGTALIVAIYLIWYGVVGMDAKISAYSFCIAVNLALFSCITHLSSITVLRSYFDDHKRLRNARVFLMVSAIGVLIPQLVASQMIDSSVTLRCALSQGDPTLQWDDNIYDQTIFFATLAMIGVIVCGYLRRILEMYFPRFRESPEAWMAEVCASLISRPTQDELGTFAVGVAKEQLARASRLSATQTFSLRGSGDLALRLVAGVIPSELSRSFFAEIIWLLFYFTFGLSQVIFFIVWGSVPDNVDSKPVSLTPGFGQILPLILLGLPFLSAIEAYTSKGCS